MLILCVCICCRGYNGCCVFCLKCEAWSSYMGIMRVLPRICCMFVSCVHPVAFLNAAFCITYSLLRMQGDTIWKRRTPEPVS